MDALKVDNIDEAVKVNISASHFDKIETKANVILSSGLVCKSDILSLEELVNDKFITKGININNFTDVPTKIGITKLNTILPEAIETLRTSVDINDIPNTDAIVEHLSQVTGSVANIRELISGLGTPQHIPVEDRKVFDTSGSNKLVDIYKVDLRTALLDMFVFNYDIDLSEKITYSISNLKLLKFLLAIIDREATVLSDVDNYVTNIDVITYADLTRIVNSKAILLDRLSNTNFAPHALIKNLLEESATGNCIDYNKQVMKNLHKYLDVFNSQFDLVILKAI